jgi:hypothetical protein
MRDSRMNSVDLLKILRKSSQGNFFAIEIPIATKDDEKNIEELAMELEHKGKIKLREFVKREYSIYLHGIMKYASE